jgi:hypothetical protein
MPSPPDLLLTADEAPEFGIAEEYLDDFETRHPGVIAKKLSAVTSEALGRIKKGGAIVLPLLEWGDVTRQKVADLFVYELRSYEGLNADPAAVSDQNVILRAQLAREWFDGLGRGDEEDPDLEDSSDDGVSGSSVIAVESDDERGW